MKTRAAVAFGPSTPLEIVELSSDLGIARSIHTSAGGDMLGRNDISGLVEWCLQALNFDGLVMGSIPLDRINQAITEMRDGQTIRNLTVLQDRA